MNRRTWVQTSVAAGAVSLAGAGAGEEKKNFSIFDGNVSLFRWPFRRLPLDETSLLLEKMEALGVGSVLAGSFEGILQRDLDSVNRRLARACQTDSRLVPAGSVNPAGPGWERDLAICIEEHGMPAIRLHPSYHGYGLDDRRFIALVEKAVDAGMLVQIVAVFEDTRTQPAMLRVPDVDLSPLVELRPDERVQVLNWRPRGAVLEGLAEKTGVVFDVARVEGTDGIARLLEKVSPERVLFGSHAPFLIPEASLIRVHESGLPEETLRAILYQNTNRLLRRWTE